jgi:hypothetical protein
MVGVFTGTLGKTSASLRLAGRPKAPVPTQTAVSPRASRTARIFLRTCGGAGGWRKVSDRSVAYPRTEEGTRATYFLSTLQARNRGRAQVGGGVHVRADGGGEAAAEVGGAEDLFLSAMRGVAGDGDAAGGRAQPGGLGYDPRLSELGAFAELGGLGKLAGRGGTAGFGER